MKLNMATSASRLKRKTVKKKKAQVSKRPPVPGGIGESARSEAALAKTLGPKRAKTAKGRRILEQREPQAIEDAKTAMVIRGNRGSAEVMNLLRDLYRLRGPLALFYSRKHEEHPFEDLSGLEHLCNKFDHSLFAFGSSSKKRPFRLILGRIFDKQVLDMQEYAVTNYKSINQFVMEGHVKAEAVLWAKPMVIFQGPAFELDDRLKRTKSLLMDYFRGPQATKVLLEGLEHVIVCTAGDDVTTPAAVDTSVAQSLNSDDLPPPPPVTVKRFCVKFMQSGSKLPRVELEEVGPSFTMTLDRSRDPIRDRWKQAIKVPKQAKAKAKVKNVKTEELGKKRGTIHLGKQHFDQIHTVHHGKAKLASCGDDGCD